jgi:RNA polymerase sigma factor (sigma-70 family)
LTDLGVVSKLTLSYIRNTRSGYVSKEQLRSDTFLVQTFKNYLKRSGVRTNQLKPNDWDKIQREVEKQWSKLELDSPSPTIGKTRQELDSIGACVRQAIEIQPVDSLDRVLNSDNGEQTLGEKVVKDRIDSEDRESLHKGCDRLLPVIETAIATLDPLDSAILKMYYQEGLMQQKIGEKLGEEQSSISRTLREIHRRLLKASHQQIDNPNNSESKINQTSIAAMKQSLKILYQN